MPRKKRYLPVPVEPAISSTVIEWRPHPILPDVALNGYVDGKIFFAWIDYSGEVEYKAGKATMPFVDVGWMGHRTAMEIVLGLEEAKERAQAAADARYGKRV